ncbi:EamA family transporter [bacterium AH-315-J23]|nr:EamA family transporter [bacterium AH-315-J23]
MSGAKFSNLWLLVPVTLLLWGTEYTLVGTIDAEVVSEAWQVVIRMVFAALFMVVFVYMRGNKLPNLRDKSWIAYGTMGFIGMTIPFYLIARGYNEGVDSGLISILIGVTPLFTVILAHFFVRSEPLTKLKSLGFFIGFIGVCVLFLPNELSWALVDNWQAQALIVLAAFGYAATSILGKRAPEQPASVGAALMLLGGALSALLGTFMLAGSDIPGAMPPAKIIGTLAALTIGATFFGNLLYLRLLQISGPSLIAKINYIVPIVAIISGMVFLSEGLQSRYIIALIIILAGLYIARLGENHAKQ